jgi:hypothetical protein
MALSRALEDMIDLKRRGLFSTPVALMEIGAQQLADARCDLQEFRASADRPGQPVGAKNFSDLAPRALFWSKARQWLRV